MGEYMHNLVIKVHQSDKADALKQHLPVRTFVDSYPMQMPGHLQPMSPSKRELVHPLLAGCPTPQLGVSLKSPAPTKVLNTDLIERLSGSTVGSARFLEILSEYESIFQEISRLRELDLQDIHPAVIFEPTAPYRKTR